MKPADFLVAVSLVAGAASCSLLPGSGSAPPPLPTGVVYPTDSGVINVMSYGATGNGVSDDTVAIQNAISANLNFPTERILYFPNGTYRITQPLVWKDGSGTAGNSLSLQGQSQTGTVIQLANSTAAFASASSPQAVVYTSFSSANSALSAGPGSGNNISDLTIDTGTGNPGAIGIDYAGSNQCVVKNTTVQSGDGQGIAGLQMVRTTPTGPCLFLGVTVQGFNTGVLVQNGQTSATFSNLTLTNQTVAGLHCSGSPVQIDNLTSTNSVPAVVNDDASLGVLSLIKSTFSGGDGSGSAVVNSNSARMFVHDITASGYASTLTSDGVVPDSGSEIYTWTSLPILSSFQSESHSLDLSVENAPSDYSDNNFSDWASVQASAYGNCKGTGDDCTTSIQAAIDSGKPVIYFPLGTYSISGTIHVRGNARLLVGFGAAVGPAAGFPSGQPGFSFESTVAGTVTMERIRLWQFATATPTYFPVAIVDAASAQTNLVLKDMSLGQSGLISYETQSGSSVGPVYFLDVVGSNFVFTNQTVRARQLDLEPGSSAPQTLITNNGGSVWISGLKVGAGNSSSTVAETTNGGETEILGAILYPGALAPVSVPAFLNLDSKESLVYSVGGPHDYDINVQETQAGVTKNLYRWNSSSSPKVYGSATIPSDVPLFAGF